MRQKSVFNLLRLSLLFAILVSVGSAMAQEGFRFAPALPAGNYYVNQEYFSSTNQTIGTKKSQGSSRFSFYWLMTVDEMLPESGQVVHLSLQRVLFEGRGGSTGARPTLFDTNVKSAAKGNLKEVYSKVSGASMTVSFDPQMKILSVDGVRAFIDTITEAAGDDPQAQLFVQYFSATFDDSSLYEMFAQMFYLPPDDTIVKGSRWKKETKITIPDIGETPLAWNCEFTKIENVSGTKLGTLYGTSSIEPAPGVNVSVTLTATYDTVSQLNQSLTARSVISSETNQTIDGQEVEVRTTGLVTWNQKIIPR